jgi:hypothetical protein
MKRIIIMALAIAGVALSSQQVAAVANKYPAANFEPSVIYIDKDAVAEDQQEEAQAQPEFDPRYPAANFAPTVVYVDKDLIEEAEDKTDPKYPAAYFKPKIIYP